MKRTDCVFLPSARQATWTPTGSCGGGVGDHPRISAPTQRRAGYRPAARRSAGGNERLDRSCLSSPVPNRRVLWKADARQSNGVLQRATASPVAAVGQMRVVGTAKRFSITARARCGRRTVCDIVCAASRTATRRRSGTRRRAGSVSGSRAGTGRSAWMFGRDVRAASARATVTSQSAPPPGQRASRADLRGPGALGRDRSRRDSARILRRAGGATVAVSPHALVAHAMKR